jgi:hypothetical protein
VARKRKRRQGRAQLKVRLPEALRREIEAAAAQRGHSMNTEIVERLLVFDKTRDAKKLVAQALLDTLDDEIIGHIVAEATAPDIFGPADLSSTPEAPRSRATEEVTEKDSVVLDLMDELGKQIGQRPRPTGEATEKDSVVLDLMDELRKQIGQRPRPNGEATKEDSRKRGTRK